MEEVASPDGKHVAAVFERNCGATTPYVRVVSLRSSDAAFDPEDDDDWVFTIHGQSDVKVAWAADDRITVSYSGTGDQPTRREKWHEIAISYE
jgi:hypothetical protein